MECPICHSGLKPFKEIPEIKDHFLTKETFKIAECANCELLKTVMPESVNLDKYYDSDDYISHGGKKLNPLHLAYRIARKYTLRQKRDLLNSLNTEKTILDFGCGTGDFLNYMQSNKWSISGIEPSERARRNATLKVGTEINKSISDTSDKFSIITAWHVLEHTLDPIETIQKLSERLNIGGKLLIAIPNYKSFDANKYKGYWAGYDVPRHLWHFSPKTIKQLAAKLGLTVQKTIPMKLDAYYVSLLSEKYIHTNKLGLETVTRAIISGNQSNSEARRTGNYSSLIYILTK